MERGGCGNVGRGGVRMKKRSLTDVSIREWADLVQDALIVLLEDRISPESEKRLEDMAELLKQIRGE